MSRKDYVLIAEAIKRVVDEANAEGKGEEFTNGVRRAVGELSLAFAKNNERFDMDRFVTACGLL